MVLQLMVVVVLVMMVLVYGSCDEDNDIYDVDKS